MTPNLIETRIPHDTSIQTFVTNDVIVKTVKQLHQTWDAARSSLELTWQQCWATYFGTPAAQRWLRTLAIDQSVGDVRKDARHHITQGKGYDVVETAVHYLYQATFPNKQWFDVTPLMPVDEPDMEMYLRIIKHYMLLKLRQAKFYPVWNNHLRQLSVLGTSVISLPWRYETKKQKQWVYVQNYETAEAVEVEKVIHNAPDLRVEDMFNIWLDPDETDPERASLIRRFTLRRGEVVRLIKDGVYDKINPAEVKDLRAYYEQRDPERVDVDSFYGVDTASASDSDVIELFEFWGSLSLPGKELYDVCLTWSGDKLMRLETNPYEGGRPFVVGRYTPIVESPYGLGILQPILGNLQELDILANTRLDGLEQSLAPTLLMMNDGTVDPNELFVEPGRVIPVGNPDGIRPLLQDNTFASVSIQEESMREEIINRRTGTGQFVGTSPGRDAERVTAKEVQAVQQAGGSRLTGVFVHIEQTSLKVLLEKFYSYAQQFVVDQEIVPVPGRSSDELLYAAVGFEQLAYDMMIEPVGADHIAEKEYDLRQTLDWISVLNSNPLMANYIDWEAVTMEVTRKFIRNNPERFIKAPEQPQQPQGQQMPVEAQEAVNAQMQADGGVNLMAGALANQPQQPQFINPEQRQALGL